MKFQVIYKGIFLNIQGSLLILNFCHIFIETISVVSNMLTLPAISTQHLVQNCPQLVILGQLHTVD